MAGGGRVEHDEVVAAAAAPSACAWVSSQILTMLTSSLAPGAAAAKYWKVPLEASTRPETRPPSACSHSSSARSGSIEMLRQAARSSSRLDARLRRARERRTAPAAASARRPRRRSCAARARPRAAPSAAAMRGLADAALAGDDEQLARPAATASAGQSVSNACAARPAATYNRADERTPSERADRRAGRLRRARPRAVRRAGLEHAARC